MRKNEGQKFVNDRAENVEGIDDDSDTIKVMSGHKKFSTNWKKKHFETFNSTILAFVFNNSHFDSTLIQEYRLLQLLIEKNLLQR